MANKRKVSDCESISAISSPPISPSQKRLIRTIGDCDMPTPSPVRLLTGNNDFILNLGEIVPLRINGSSETRILLVIPKEKKDLGFAKSINPYIRYKSFWTNLSRGKFVGWPDLPHQFLGGENPFFLIISFGFYSETLVDIDLANNASLSKEAKKIAQLERVINIIYYYSYI